jgi:hypothetical protein
VIAPPGTVAPRGLSESETSKPFTIW